MASTIYQGGKPYRSAGCLECGIECEAWDRLPYTRRFMCRRCKAAMLQEIAERTAGGILRGRGSRISSTTLLELWDKMEAERLGISPRNPRGAYSKRPKHG